MRIGRPARRGGAGRDPSCRRRLCVVRLLPVVGHEPGTRRYDLLPGPLVCLSFPVLPPSHALACDRPPTHSAGGGFLLN